MADSSGMSLREADFVQDEHSSEQAPAETGRSPQPSVESRLKRALDIVVALGAITFFAPALVVIVIAVKLDSAGPVLFMQRRNGVNREVFKIFKFRSMTTMDDGAVVQQATRGDSRITRVGGFLRRTSLDELPQLFNVLRGEMSIVGPRPHALAHDDHYSRLIPLYTRRFEAKPGMTGLAQVEGFRGETETIDKMEARIDCDVQYIDNWSIWLDIKIIFRTASVVLFGQRTAY